MPDDYGVLHHTLAQRTSAVGTSFITKTFAKHHLFVPDIRVSVSPTCERVKVRENCLSTQQSLSRV